MEIITELSLVREAVKSIMRYIGRIPCIESHRRQEQWKTTSKIGGLHLYEQKKTEEEAKWPEIAKTSRRWNIVAGEEAKRSENRSASSMETGK